MGQFFLFFDFAKLFIIVGGFLKGVRKRNLGGVLIKSQ